MNIRQIKGATLIEVLVALVVLLGGIAASATLQRVFISNASDAKNRTLATSLAQQKINDLKAFTQITTPVDADGNTITWSSADPTMIMAYQYIGGNSGGIIASGAQNLTSNTQFNLTWASQDHWYTGQAEGTTAPSPIRLADYKTITVNVTWNDESGDQQSIDLDTNISISASNGSAKVIPEGAGGGLGGYGPEVIHTPGAIPDVLPIFCSAGDCIETSKPLPNVVQTGQRENTIVTWEAVTYDNDGGNITLSQEESLTLSCNCKFDAADGNSNTPAHNIWFVSGGEAERLNTIGDFLSKPTASAVDGNSDLNDSEAQGFCTICCRDHHDGGSGQTIFYNSAGSAANDHPHFDASGTSVTTGIYIESCRFKRINGIWRVFQDWNLQTLTVLPRDSLADATLQDAYINYVIDYVQNEASGDGRTVTKPNPSDLRDPVFLAIDASRQLQSRGIYLDNVYNPPAGGNAASDGAISTSYIAYIADILTNTDYLNKIPFTEVNLTLLSDWTASDANATVTSEPVNTIPDTATDYYGVYSRGWTTGVSATTASTVTSSIESGNNGITNTTNESSTAKTDTVGVTITASTGTVNLSGSYAISSFTLAAGEQLTVTIAPASSCAIVRGDKFECSMAAPYTGLIEINASIGKNNRPERCAGSSSSSFSGTTSDDNSIVLTITLACLS